MTQSFAELQAQLRPEWGREHDGNGVDFDLLMLPSLSVDRAQLELIEGVHNYEERQLFSLIRLRDPGVRMVYVTSKLLPELVVDSVL
ncbi:MAG: carboxylate-amine ligase, partial [Synechococcaceae cyanobacterium ELA182]